MKFICFLLIVIMSQDNYNIEQVSDIKKRLQAESKNITDFDTQLQTNLAFVYTLKTGEVAMIPGNYTNESRGLVFKDKNCYLEYLQKDHFPIENERMLIQEKHQAEVLEVNNNTGKLFSQLSEKMNMPPGNEAVTAAALSALLQKIRTEKNKLSKKEIFYAALLLGEYLRITGNGHWLLLKQYGTFNPYYTPAILYADKTIVLFWDYLNSYFTNPGITPENYANLPYIKKPSLSFESNFFKVNFPAYKELH
jgi:hypothetical protein